MLLKEACCRAFVVKKLLFFNSCSSPFFCVIGFYSFAYIFIIMLRTTLIAVETWGEALM